MVNGFAPRVEEAEFQAQRSFSIHLDAASEGEDVSALGNGDIDGARRRLGGELLIDDAPGDAAQGEFSSAVLPIRSWSICCGSKFVLPCMKGLALRPARVARCDRYRCRGYRDRAAGGGY